MLPRRLRRLDVLLILTKPCKIGMMPYQMKPYQIKELAVFYFHIQRLMVTQFGFLRLLGLKLLPEIISAQALFLKGFCKHQTNAL